MTVCPGSGTPLCRMREQDFYLCRRDSELTPSRIDMEVLRELPLDVQQEVAADLARARRLAAMRPRHQPSFVQRPASEQQREPPPPATEASQEVWLKIAGALDCIEGRLLSTGTGVEGS